MQPTAGRVHIYYRAWVAITLNLRRHYSETWTSLHFCLTLILIVCYLELNLGFVALSLGTTRQCTARKKVLVL